MCVSHVSQVQLTSLREGSSSHQKMTADASTSYRPRELNLADVELGILLPDRTSSSSYRGRSMRPGSRSSSISSCLSDNVKQSLGIYRIASRDRLNQSPSTKRHRSWSPEAIVRWKPLKKASFIKSLKARFASLLSVERESPEDSERQDTFLFAESSEAEDSSHGKWYMKLCCFCHYPTALEPIQEKNDVEPKMRYMPPTPLASTPSISKSSSRTDADAKDCLDVGVDACAAKEHE